MGSKRPKPHFTEVFAFPKRPKGLVWDAWKTGFQLVYSGSGRLLTVKFMKTSKPVSFVLLFYSCRFRIVAVVAINFTTPKCCSTFRFRHRGDSYELPANQSVK